MSGKGSQPTRLSDVLNLKNVKTIWGIKLIFCFYWSYKNIILFWVMLENTLDQSVCRIFYFRFVWLVILIPRVHCYIVIVWIGGWWVSGWRVVCGCHYCMILNIKIYFDKKVIFLALVLVLQWNSHPCFLIFKMKSNLKHFSIMAP